MVMLIVVVSTGLEFREDGLIYFIGSVVIGIEVYGVWVEFFI